MLQKLPHLFLEKLRLSKPWRYKAPFLISIPYLMMLFGNMPPAEAGKGFLMSCLTIFGIAGLGYLLNDYSDRAEDAKAGKPNLLLKLPGMAILALFLLFMGLAIFPWLFYFPRGWSTWGLLGFELLLFVLYSAPPFRFKERGWWGVLCDAGYAHAVPAVLAALTFFYLGNREYALLWPFLVVLGSWQGMVGVRNILLHMLSDLGKDQQTGTATLAVNLGKGRLNQILKSYVMPLEVLTFSAFGGMVMLEVSWFSLFMGLYYVQLIYKYRFVNGSSFPLGFPERMTLWLDDFYVLWFPWFALLSLVALNPWFWLLALVHVLVFRNALGELRREFLQWTREQRVRYVFLGLALLMSGQLIQTMRTGEYFPALILPMFSQAPAFPNAEHLEHEILLENGETTKRISGHELLVGISESTRATLLYQNMGYGAAQQNQQADFEAWLKDEVEKKWPGEDWKSLAVKWFSWAEGKRKAELGVFKVALGSEEGGEGE